MWIQSEIGKVDAQKYAEGVCEVMAQLLLYDARSVQKIHAVAEELVARHRRVAELEQREANIDLADADMALGWVQTAVADCYNAVLGKK